ncbi:MAG: ABC transporter ATP-binding protein [Victivallaceae bacterium]|nr:ABC transporter ATP-binding protein [Victivallaceae bacterium]
MSQFSFLRLIKPYRYLVFGSVVSLFAFSTLGLALPWMLKIAIDRVIPNADYGLFLLLCFGMLLIFSARTIFFFISNYLMTYTSMRALLDIRQKLFKHLQSLSLRFYEEYRTGKLISNVINDVAQMQQLITIFTSIINQSFIILAIAAVLLFLNFKMALVVLALLPVYFINFYYFRRIMRDNFLVLQEKMSEISANLGETINGIKVVKTFSKERTECREFFSSLRPTLDLNVKLGAQSVTCWSITDYLNLLVYLLTIGLGMTMVRSSNMTLGEFVAFYTYVGMFVAPISALSIYAIDISRGMTGAKRINNLLNVIPEIKEPAKPLKIEKMKGHIVFKNVSFKYKDVPVIKNFSLDIKPGQKVALVGPSGSGKSTITNLLLRFYDIQEGELSIDGVPINRYSSAAYREHIGVVLQEPFLFSGSIRDNIAYAKKDATRSEVERAAAMANVDEFVTDMENGYDTVIGENGASLSGGQKQRLAIARAILKNPSLLILDEATSALDTVSEFLVQTALDNLMHDKTTIIIAHRLSTIKNADLIVVMDSGEIVQMGAHDELMRHPGVYQELYNAQQKVNS